MIRDLRRKTDLLLAELEHARRSCREEKSALRESRIGVRDAEEARALVQIVAEKMQSNATERIASVVTSCLRSVFGDGGEFKVAFRRSRGKTEARLAFFTADGKEESPLEASSGGRLDVAALALRLVAILLSRPTRRRLLVLDEPLRNLNGDEYREKARILIEELARKMNFQIIFVTGFRWLQCGEVIDVS